MKWIGSVTQTVSCLLCKCEAPSSYPSPTTNNKILEWVYSLVVANLPSMCVGPGFDVQLHRKKKRPQVNLIY
jgi:hypothetical protein